MTNNPEKADAELTPEDYRKRARAALQEAERSTDPAIRSYLRGLAQDLMLKAAQAVQRRPACR